MKGIGIKKRICCLLSVIIIALSGMSEGTIGADIALYSAQKNTAVSFCAQENLCACKEPCTRDLLGECDIRSITSYDKCTNTKSNVEVNLTISFPANRPENSFYTIQTRCPGVVDTLRSQSVIVSYIHQKDGEKGKTA